MKIKLLVSRSGADGAFGRGDIIEVSEAEAVRMIAAEQAEAIDAMPRGEARTEKAVKAAKPEKAVK
jgi:hypothetical protein